MRIQFRFYLCLFFAVLVFEGCSKSNNNSSTTGQAPEISGINPAEGPQGTQVTIKGKGFSTTASLDTVYFNGKQAPVTSASDTQLVVTVPPLAGTGNVTVHVKETADGPVFTYDYQYMVTTLAGGNANIVDGTGTNAGFGALNGISNDGTYLYLGDISSDQMRKVTMTQGVVTTFAGSGPVLTDANGSLSTAGFATPADVIVSGSTFYVLDAGSGTNGASIRMISGSTVSSITGGGAKGNTNGTGSGAHFGNCWGFAMDGSGNFYIADANNNMIRKVTSAGTSSTFAGNGGVGSVDATGTNALFDGPYDIAIDHSGNLFVSDQYNNKIREITPAGVVTTFAGSGTAGSADGTGTAASFNLPEGLAFDNNGNLFVADMNSQKIRKITPDGVVTTIAGTGSIALTNGLGSVAAFAYPADLTVDTNGNIYVADGSNVIRKLALQ